MTAWGEPAPYDGAWGAAPNNASPHKHAASKPLVEGGDEWDAGLTTTTEQVPAQTSATQVELPDVRPGEHGWVQKEKMNSAIGMATEKELADRSDVPLWSSQAQKYEWRDEYGDVGPEDPELEHQLFFETFRPVKGEALGIIGTMNVEISDRERYEFVDTMDEAGLHPLLLENLKKAGYGQTTPIQAWTIPVAMAGRDVMGVSQTGSGKTVAYLAPVLSKLMGKANKYSKPKPNPESYDQKTNGITAEPLVLIIVPTRELALQVYAEARRLCYRSKLRPCCVYGGAAPAVQINDLMRGCDILIGTPGRLRDFITTRSEAVSLIRLKFTILDEADELLDMDWKDQLGPMITGPTAHHNDARQFLMFSATFNREAREAAAEYLAEGYTKIVVGRLGSTHINIHQVVVWAEDNQKEQCLVDMLCHLPVARTMIFCSSIDRVHRLDDYLYRLNFPSNPLTGRMTQREREEAMEKFKRGTSPILVTTHLGGRGIDVESVQHVVIYDFPSNQQGGIGAYCHQIGRTGRIGNKGQATSLVNDRNADLFPELAKTLLENHHDLPGFLVEFAPSDGKIEWEDLDDTPSMDQTNGNADTTASAVGGGGWGTETRGVEAPAADDGGW